MSAATKPGRLMDLSRHVEALRAEVTAAAAVGGPEIARAAGLIVEAMDAAVRLVLLDVLTAAASDLTAAMDGSSVDVRLRGREPELILTGPVPTPAAPSDDEGTARLTLRLPETLKSRAEQAAAAEGISVNSWLVRAVHRALAPAAMFAGGPGPRRVTGFGRA